MRIWARLYLVAVALGSIGLVITQSFDTSLLTYATALVLLTIASFLAQVYELEILPHFGLSTQVALALAAVYIGGISLGISVALLSTLPAEFLLRWDRLKESPRRFIDLVTFNVSQLVLSASAAALVFGIVCRYGGLNDREYAAMVAAFFAYIFVNNALVAGIVALNRDGNFFKVLRFGFKNMPLQFITMGVLAILMYTLYTQAALNLALVFIPLALVHYSVRSYLRLRRDSHNAFKKITDLLGHRDQYTGAHSDDVEELTMRLAESVGLSDEDVEAIVSGAAIHDIGKIAIPDAILNKIGPLDHDEFETMKTHTIIGSDIISNMDIYRNVVPIVRHEHEHWDGGGYPDGLTGETIPLGARIVAVADVYSALTTERAYRPAQGKPIKYTPEQACAILYEMAGGVLDPRLVDAFVRKVLGFCAEEAPRVTQ